MPDDTAKKPDVDALPAPGVAQSFASPVPPQSVSSFNQAVQQLALTPQEQNLYQHHLNNLWGGGRVVQPGGDVSTVLQAVVQGPDGRYYNIPTVWNGQALPVDAAQRQAALAGWGNWPAYATPQAADDRYMAMHGMMERDTAAWLAQNPNADPMAAMLMRQQAAQHPVLQMLEQLRQQQAAPPGRQGQAEPLPPGTQLAGDVVPMGGNQGTARVPGLFGEMLDEVQHGAHVGPGWDFFTPNQPWGNGQFAPPRAILTPPFPANDAMNVSPDLLRLLNPPVA